MSNYVDGYTDAILEVLHLIEEWVSVSTNASNADMLSFLGVCVSNKLDNIASLPDSTKPSTNKSLLVEHEE